MPLAITWSSDHSFPFHGFLSREPVAENRGNLWYLNEVTLCDISLHGNTLHHFSKAFQFFELPSLLTSFYSFCCKSEKGLIPALFSFLIQDSRSTMLWWTTRCWIGKKRIKWPWDPVLSDSCPAIYPPSAPQRVFLQEWQGIAKNVLRVPHLGSSGPSWSSRK